MTTKGKTPVVSDLLLKKMHFVAMHSLPHYFVFISAVGVPIKLIHEAEGHIVTIELKNGEIYRGLLQEAEDTMNCKLNEVIMTGRDGRVAKMEHVFLRGGQIKLFVLPEILKSAKVLQKVQSMKSKSGERAPPSAGGKNKRQRTGP